MLIMDDEPNLRRLLCDCLVALKCHVDCAENGEQAVSLFRAASQDNPFDVVILDLTVPGGMGGAETLAELQRLDPGVLAVACSGYANDPILCDHETHGFAGALEKPFRFGMLAVTVRRLIAQRRRTLSRDSLVRS